MKSTKKTTAAEATQEAPAPDVAAVRSMTRKIEVWPIDRIKAYNKNPRWHSEQQVLAIMDSIRRFGFTNPILLSDAKGGIIVAGHGRLKGAAQLGMRELPVILLDHLSPAELRAYRIADNQIALMSEWDPDLLRSEIGALEDADFDLSALAFEDEDLAAFMAPAKATTREKDPEDEPAVAAAPLISVPGDVWLLGKHRLGVIDCLDAGAVEGLLGGVKADLVFTDPPYNVAYKGYTEEKMEIAGDAMSTEAFRAFLLKVFRAYRALMKASASIYVFHPSSFQRAFENAMVAAGLEVRCQIIWAKNTFAWGHGRYKFQHEPIFYGCLAGASDRWYGDKTQSTLWAENKPASNRIHPTAKPVELVIRALNNSTKQGDLVVDFFGGSGSTMMGCEVTGRRAILTEIDPKYSDRIVQRWQEFTGRPARLLGDENNRTFAEVARDRREAAEASAVEAPVA